MTSHSANRTALRTRELVFGLPKKRSNYRGGGFKERKEKYRSRRAPLEFSSRSNLAPQLAGRVFSFVELNIVPASISSVLLIFFPRFSTTAILEKATLLPFSSFLCLSLFFILNYSFLFFILFFNF